MTVATIGRPVAETLRSEWWEANAGHASVYRERDRWFWTMALEVGMRAFEHDATTHPYVNWGHSTRLDWTLDRLRTLEARR